MKIKTVSVAVLAFAALAAWSLGAAAGTARQEAIDAGATQLTSDEIADLVVGKTVTAVSGEKRFLFHYGADNVLSGKLVGGDWSGAGYYGITDDDRVCVSMAKDKGRLGCMTVLRWDGVVRKYRVDGAMSFEFLETQEGNRL